MAADILKIKFPFQEYFDGIDAPDNTQKVYLSQGMKTGFPICMLPRIMFLTRSLEYGGAERQLVQLAIAMHQRGIPVHVVSFYGGGPLCVWLESEGVRVSIVGKSGRWDVPGFLWRLYRIVREENPDVLHSYLVAPNLVASLLRLVLRNTCIVWGVRASDMRLAHYDKLVRLAFWMSCRMSNRADLIIANSYSGLEFHVKQGYPAERMRVIHNGIDVNRFTSDVLGRQKYRQEWGGTEDEVLIGIVARLDPMKDHTTFLKAASLLLNKRRDVRFICVGDGPLHYKAELKKTSESLGCEGRVVWTGSYDDMVPVYSALDIVTSSSAFGEGFSNVLGEAMSCGVPCVATNVGDSDLIISDIGELVSPGDPLELMAAWELLIDRIQAGEIDHEQMRRHIHENFSIDCMVDSTLVELQKCE